MQLQCNLNAPHSPATCLPHATPTNFALCWRRAAIAPHAACGTTTRRTSSKSCTAQSCLPFYRMHSSKMASTISNVSQRERVAEAAAARAPTSLAGAVAGADFVCSLTLSVSLFRCTFAGILFYLLLHNLFSFFVLLTFPKMYYLCCLCCFASCWCCCYVCLLDWRPRLFSSSSLRECVRVRVCAVVSE